MQELLTSERQTHHRGAETRRTAKVGESKSLPLIDADKTDQERNRDIGRSGHRKPKPTAEGGNATREIGDRERKRKPPAGGQAVGAYIFAKSQARAPAVHNAYGYAYIPRSLMVCATRLIASM
jgi:hypothetical protein